MATEIDSGMGELHDAGEMLRLDYECAAFGLCVTMTWFGAPVARSRGGKSAAPDASFRQICAHCRFDKTIAADRPGLSDILGRII